MKASNNNIYVQVEPVYSNQTFLIYQYVIENLEINWYYFTETPKYSLNFLDFSDNFFTEVYELTAGKYMIHVGKIETSSTINR